MNTKNTKNILKFHCHKDGILPTSPSSSLLRLSRSPLLRVAFPLANQNRASTDFPLSHSTPFVSIRVHLWPVYLPRMNLRESAKSVDECFHVNIRRRPAHPGMGTQRGTEMESGLTLGSVSPICARPSHARRRNRYPRSSHATYSTFPFCPSTGLRTTPFTRQAPWPSV